MSIKQVRKTFFYAIVLLISIGCSQEAAQKTDNEKSTEGELVIENLFIKQLPPGQTVAAAYMKITNNTKSTQPLNYVHSPVAEHIEVHRNFYEDGMMQMRQVKKLTVSPGEKRVLEPGGFHLMIFGIYDELKVGDTFDITFEFETGLVLTEKVEVRPHG